MRAAPPAAPDSGEPEQVSPGLELRELDSELEQALRSLGPLEWARP